MPLAADNHHGRTVAPPWIRAAKTWISASATTPTSEISMAPSDATLVPGSPSRAEASRLQIKGLLERSAT